jgi:DNA-binding transcriptional ArsR family regulator
MKKRVAQFSALGQEDRLEILRVLVRAGPDGNCVDQIRRRLKMPGSTLSHHLEALTRSKLISARRAGRFIYYAVNWRETAGLIRFLTEDCCADLHLAMTEPRADTTIGTAASDVCCTPDEPSVRRARQQS